MTVGIVFGNVLGQAVVSVALTPSIVGANTSAEQTFTLPGVRAAQDVVVGVSKPTTQAGLGIVGFRISADNTLAITFGNFSASGITPTAGETYQVEIIRRESTQSGFSV